MSSCEGNFVSDRKQNSVQKIAESITVKIDTQYPGSGFIVASGNGASFILTASHVVETKDEYDIYTPDGEFIRIKAEEYDNKIQKLPDIDLAIIKLDTDTKYLVPEFRTDEVSETSTLHVAGFPAENISRRLSFVEGLTVSNDLAAEPLTRGYGLIYNNETLPGMSGGPVLDQLGRVVGVHGRAEQVLTDSGWEKTGFNLGIPIWTYRELILSSLPVRITTANRKEIVRDFFDSVNIELSPGCAPPRNVQYSSVELASPNADELIYIEGELLSFKYCESDIGTPETRNTNIVVKANNGSERFEYMPQIFQELDLSITAISISPISFSPDGRYVIVKESVNYGPTELDEGFSIIDMEDSKKVRHINPCAISDTEYAIQSSFNGFISPKEISYTCSVIGQSGGLGDTSLVETIFSLEDMTVKSIDREGTQVDDYPSYGSFLNSYKVVTDK